MTQTAREVVRRTLSFAHPDRMANNYWILPWFREAFPGTAEILEAREDFIKPPSPYRPGRLRRGNPYAAGTFIDDWGCEVVNLAAGTIGEVKTPLLPDLAEWQKVAPPYEMLPAAGSRARGAVDAFCRGTDRFVLANCCPNVWERYQFLRGSENALMDIGLRPPELPWLLGTIADYFRAEMDFWLGTAVDGIMIGDDWGTQTALLIAPDTWRELFKPIYQDMVRRTHAAGKFLLMHSDGHIAAILEDLVEIGVDAVNAQLFCMDVEDLGRRYRGRITFWGEVDRQQALGGPPEKGRAAVRRMLDALYDPTGGLIGQFEAGVGADPETVLAVADELRNAGRCETCCDGSRKF